MVTSPTRSGVTPVVANSRLAGTFLSVTGK
jgi:hypothetical protein